MVLACLLMQRHSLSQCSACEKLPTQLFQRSAVTRQLLGEKDRTMRMAEGAICSARRPRVLLCATGSVATVKVPQLAVALRAFAEVSLPQGLARCC
jgi:hypothetical protein